MQNSFIGILILDIETAVTDVVEVGVPAIVAQGSKRVFTFRKA